MSYILDALNKADKDRKQQQAPMPTPSLEPEPTSSNTMLWFVLMTIVVALLLWWLLKPEAQRPPTITPVSVTTPTVKSEQPKVKQIKPTPEPPTQPTIQTVAKPKPQTTPNIMGLDSSVRDRLPTIQISAHIFGEDAAKRMVIINNRVLHEGDYVAEQCQLIHITPSGITLNFEGEPFTMNIKDKWPRF